MSIPKIDYQELFTQLLAAQDQELDPTKLRNLLAAQDQEMDPTRLRNMYLENEEFLAELVYTLNYLNPNKSATPTNLTSSQLDKLWDLRKLFELLPPSKQQMIRDFLGHFTAKVTRPTLANRIINIFSATEEKASSLWSSVKTSTNVVLTYVGRWINWKLTRYIN